MKLKKNIPLIDQHDRYGFWGGKFGGSFIPETLKKPVEDLTKEFSKLRNNKKFLKKRDYYFKNYIGSPTPLIKLENLTNQLDTKNFATYRELFPRDSMPVTATQLQRRLANKISSTPETDNNLSMVDLMLRTTNALGSSSELQSLRFRAKQMELTAEVLITNFEELEAIKERSQTMGITMDTTIGMITDMIMSMMLSSVFDLYFPRDHAG